jgi:hypothetical protein
VPPTIAGAPLNLAALLPSGLTATVNDLNATAGATGNLQGQINLLNAAGGDAKAGTSLSNLSSVAINTHLLPATSASANLGSGALPFGKIFGTATQISSLSVGDSTSATKVSLDSLGLVDSKIAAYIAADTTDPYITAGGRQELTDVSVMLADSSVTAQGYVTPTDMNTAIAAISSYAASRYAFIVDTTAGAPIAGDSIVIHTSLIDKHLEVYRGAEGDSLYKLYRKNVGQTYHNGYSFQKATGTIVFTPHFETNEHVIIEATDSTAWTTLTPNLYAEFQTINDAMTNPLTGDTLYWADDLVYSLDSAGFWDRIKLLYMPVAASSLADSYLNWAAVNNVGYDADYYALTTDNAPAFIRNQGWDADGAADFLKTGWIPNTDSLLVNHTGGVGRNDITIASWSLSNINAAYVPIGVTDANPLSLRMYVRNNDATSAIINSADVSALSDPGSTLGLIAVTRRAKTDVESYFNGAHVGNDTDASTGLPDKELYVLSRNNNGTADLFYNGIISIILVMDAVSDAEATAIYNIFNLYMNRTR